MPLMISRLILSLKKATKSPGAIWSAHQVSGIRFALRSTGGTDHGGDVIPLRAFVGGRGPISEL